MFKTPKECYDYIVKNELETAVIGAMMQQTDNYSIAEIADADLRSAVLSCVVF